MWENVEEKGIGNSETKTRWVKGSQTKDLIKMPFPICEILGLGECTKASKNKLLSNGNPMA